MRLVLNQDNEEFTQSCRDMLCLQMPVLRMISKISMMISK